MSEEKRAPLLSDDEIEKWVGDHSLFMPDHDEDGVMLSNGGVARRFYSRHQDQCKPEVMDADTAYFRGFQHGRDFYEAKITSGELMVVKTVQAAYGDNGGIMGYSCTDCGAPCQPDYWSYCPGCGAKIIKP